MLAAHPVEYLLGELTVRQIGIAIAPTLALNPIVFWVSRGVGRDTSSDFGHGGRVAQCDIA